MPRSIACRNQTPGTPPGWGREKRRLRPAQPPPQGRHSLKALGSLCALKAEQLRPFRMGAQVFTPTGPGVPFPSSTGSWGSKASFPNIPCISCHAFCPKSFFITASVTWPQGMRRSRISFVWVNKKPCVGVDVTIIPSGHRILVQLSPATYCHQSLAFSQSAIHPGNTMELLAHARPHLGYKGVACLGEGP